MVRHKVRDWSPSVVWIQLCCFEGWEDSILWMWAALQDREQLLVRFSLVQTKPVSGKHNCHLRSLSSFGSEWEQHLPQSCVSWSAQTVKLLCLGTLKGCIHLCSSSSEWWLWKRIIYFCWRWWSSEITCTSEGFFFHWMLEKTQS